jgi:hypothetical protein
MVDVPVRIAESGPLAESSGGSGTVTFSHQWATTTSIPVDAGVTVYGEVWDTGTDWEFNPVRPGTGNDAIEVTFGAMTGSSAQDQELFMLVQYLGNDANWYDLATVKIPVGSASDFTNEFAMGELFPAPASPFQVRLVAQYGGTPCSVSGLRVAATVYKGTGEILT